MKKHRTKSGNTTIDTGFLPQQKKVRWYIFANRTDAVFYEETHDHQFLFIARLAHEPGRLIEQELTSARPGMSHSSAGQGTIHHALEERSCTHDHEAKKFASNITATLETHARSHRFNQLVLIAEPRFLGILRRTLPLALRDLVLHQINREYSQGSDKKLRKQVTHALNYLH